jgi:predicted RNA-binding protein with TRAM domain
MVEVPDRLRSLFSVTLDERGDEHVIRVPSSAIEGGQIDPASTYQIAVLAPRDVTRDRAETPTDASRSDEDGPPVAENDVLSVTIDTVGDQGDGIAKVDRGYVLIVPDAEPGDEVTVRVETVRPNVAFTSIVEP